MRQSQSMPGNIYISRELAANRLTRVEVVKSIGIQTSLLGVIPKEEQWMDMYSPADHSVNDGVQSALYTS